MKNDPRCIAVIGAAGFVGQTLCRQLLAEGWRVHGVATSRNSFLLDHLGIQAASGRYQAVVNLAYPTSSPPVRRKAENQEILAQIRELLVPGGLLIHASTLAVFGSRLEREIVVGPIGWRPDSDYAETKLRMERGISEAFGHANQVEIVRLGNVWGAGSVHWLAGMASRVRNGLPVLVQGGRYSNATDVVNVSDYFGFLADRRAGSFVGTRYHHLAEFSAEPWSTFVGMIGNEMGMDLCETTVPEPETLRSLLVGTYIVKTYKFLSGRNLSGSMMRQVLGYLPKGLVGDVRRAKRALGMTDSEDDGLYQVLGCSRRFESATAPGWAQRLSLAESLARSAEWLRWAGFVAKSQTIAPGSRTRGGAPEPLVQP
ncbi:MAG: NAD(P)-dependent oxidoreductase [Verrucomicrobiota bacterium]|jgi:nucleoside-diphosphate-sugar epimerase